MTIEIPLTQGQTALISDEDFDLLDLKWHAMFSPKYSGKNTFMAAHSEGNGKIYLHRVVLSRMLERPLIRTEQVDHIHHNTLDCRRPELRLATPTQNKGNSRKYKTNTSGVKGVSFYKRLNKWGAFIRANSKTHYLGLFPTPELAHEAYKKAATELFGEFANFGEQS